MPQLTGPRTDTCPALATRTAMTTYHRLGDLNNQNLFPMVLEARSPNKHPVWFLARILPGLWMATSSLHPHKAERGSSGLFSQGHVRLRYRTLEKEGLSPNHIYRFLAWGCPTQTGGSWHHRLLLGKLQCPLIRLPPHLSQTTSDLMLPFLRLINGSSLPQGKVHPP